MSMFDADSFLHAQVTESNDTKRVPVPVGEYLGVVSDVKIRPWQSKTDSTKAGLALDITWELDDANLKASLGRDKITLRQGIMLDLTEQGGLDMGKGKNIGLGRIREALDLNVAGQPFSFGMIQGRMAKVVVSHRAVGEDIYTEIKRIAKAG